MAKQAAEGEPVVVQLSGNGSENVNIFGTETASFEEAFGEFSEFRGKGRARRAARKDARQKKRMTRIQNRTARKTARKVGRQQARTAKMMAKQERKNIRQENRLMRKANRKASRGGSDEAETLPEENEFEVSTEDETTMTSGPDLLTPNPADDSTSYEPEMEESEGPGEIEEDSSPGDYEDEGPDSESEYDEESSFNAENSNYDGIKVRPEVMDTTRRIVWNEAMINKLERQKSNAEGEEQIVEIDNNIKNRMERLGELLSAMDGYSEARGGKRNPVNRREFKAARSKAIAELKSGRQKDTPMPRRGLGLGRGRGEGMGMGIGRKRMQPEKGVLEVESELDPLIEKDRLEIPAEDVSPFVGDEKAPISATTFLVGFGLALGAVFTLKKLKVI